MTRYFFTKTKEILNKRKPHVKDTIIILNSTKSNDKTNTKRTHSKHIKIKKYIYK